MQIERECTAYEVEMGENNEWMFVEIILKTFFYHLPQIPFCFRYTINTIN